MSTQLFIDGKPLKSIGDLPKLKAAPALQRAPSPEFHIGPDVYKGRVTAIETDPNKELSITCEFPEEQ